MLENLKLLRSATGISQKALAEAIGVSQQSINKYENHNIEPDIATLSRIADYFHVSIDYLVGRTNCPRLPVSEGEDRLEEDVLLCRYRHFPKSKKKPSRQYWTATDIHKESPKIGRTIFVQPRKWSRYLFNLG